MAVADKDIRRIQKYNRINAQPGGLDFRPDEAQRELMHKHFKWHQEYPDEKTPALNAATAEQNAREHENNERWFIPVRADDGEEIKGMFVFGNYSEEDGGYVTIHWYASPNWLGKLWCRMQDYQNIFWYVFDYMDCQTLFGVRNHWDHSAQRALNKMGFEDHSTFNYEDREFTLIYVQEDMLKPVLRDWY